MYPQIANSSLDVAPGSLLLGVVGKLFRHAVIEEAHRLFGRRLLTGDPLTDAMFAANALAQSLASSSSGGETSTVTEGTLSGITIQVQVCTCARIHVRCLDFVVCPSRVGRRLPRPTQSHCSRCQMTQDSRAMHPCPDECCLGTQTRLRSLFRRLESPRVLFP
jgi:hypothetical protein